MVGRRQVAAGIALAAAFPAAAVADTRAEINRGADQALAELYRKDPAARTLAEKAVGLLVFPRVVKGGLLVGGEYSEGALREQGQTTGYYRLTAVSYGLQAGAQTFRYVMMLMTAEARRYIDRSEGWEIGSGPSMVVMDQGMASRMTTTTVTQDVLTFVFGQSGLMGGLGLAGTKISRFTPSR